MLTLQEALDDFYRIRVVERKATSTLRLRKLADLCIQELDKRGLKGAAAEMPIPGIGRQKMWDVAWSYNGKVRLGISLKSIVGNLGGSVPNRADDLMGEMANVQLYSPEIVTGYIMVFDIQKDVDRRMINRFREHVAPLAGRKAPAWAAGMVEALVIVEVDFSTGPTLVSPSGLDDFFETLVEQATERNPGLSAP